MKILHIARHGQECSNDDEGAVGWALEQLGHEVVRVHERQAPERPDHRPAADFALVHHWRDTAALERLNLPKVFWCFDLVDSDDPQLQARCAERRDWAARMTRVCDLGFLTDGDWVAKDRTGKLHRLPQGADARKIGRGDPDATIPVPEGCYLPARTELLFAGTGRGGTGRRGFIRDLQDHYGREGPEKLLVISRGVYGRDFANLIARAGIIVAPDAPFSDRYASNRVFLASGFGAFLLHPYSDEVAGWYRPGEEIVTYTCRAELHAKVRHFSQRPEERRRISSGALARTLADHTYTDRCRILIDTVRRRLKL